MSEANELSAQILPVGDDWIVLPNGVVVEILRQVALTPAAPPAPSWLLGTFSWQGMEVPLVSFSSIAGRQAGAETGRKCVVVKTLDPNAPLPCYALYADAFPQFVDLTRQGLLLDASVDQQPTGVRTAVLVGGRTTLVPDLDHIEGLVNQWHSTYRLD